MFSLSYEELTFYGILLTLLELTAIILALHALLNSRTSQGALAWTLSLVFLPFITIPLYLAFGRRRFSGYVQAHRLGKDLFEKALEPAAMNCLKDSVSCPDKRRSLVQGLEKLSGMPMTGRNRHILLINGEATFTAIFDAISKAESYILVQFFILKADNLGQQLKRALVEKARLGVRVYVLYDAIGSYNLPDSFKDELKQAGAEILPFRSSIGRTYRFQINFRNHRKIVVIDGVQGFVGGHNVGDEYLGKTRRYGHWRDTHLHIEGPATLELQLSFLRDWYWAARKVPELTWTPHLPQGETSSAIVVPCGPSDSLDTGSLFFLALIQSARHRIWLTSPYFVPDEAVLEALQLAVLRGVDVRILLPGKPDKWLPWMAAYAFIHEAGKAGVRCFRYTPGFLHQKVVLVDDDISSVGTANLDNRSLRLNFEVSHVVADTSFAEQVERMLLNDLQDCREIDPSSVAKMNLFKRIVISGSRLMSPLL